MLKLEKISHWFRGEQKLILFMKFNPFYDPLTKNKQTQNEFKYTLYEVYVGSFLRKWKQEMEISKLSPVSERILLKSP